MRLADFIDRNTAAILQEWESFASTLLPAADGMTSAALRDHAEQILHAVACDLRTTQTDAQQVAKSQGRAPVVPNAPDTAAQSHAVGRAHEGFTIRQMVAEYRALRAGVLKLWAKDAPYGPEAIEDVGRFNEAIDQAIAESVDYFTNEVDRRRDLFLGILGHDLRSPLNAVLMTSQAISAMTLGTPVCEHTQRLIRSGERMSRLLDDLLDYNRASLQLGVRVERELIDLAQVCQEEMEILKAALPHSTITFTASGDTVGRWDESRMRQVVSNFVTNAAKYGESAAAIRIHLEGDASQIRLSVENDGPTIPKERLMALFDPLRRLGSAESLGERESLGLGLYIARQVAIAHGGDVSVESESGRTCFAVTLPR